MKEIYEGKDYLVEELINDMVDLFKEHNEVRKQYLKTDEIGLKRELVDKSSELLNEALAIKKILSYLFGFSTKLSFVGDGFLESIEVYEIGQN